MSENQMLISIITPCYNSENYIEETINSVLNQSYQNWEMLIVDDNSSDNSTTIIRECAQKDIRIKPEFFEYNRGAAIARTRAMELAKGDYIAFLDSDDLWHKDKLSIQLRFMQENRFNFTCTMYNEINEQGKSTGAIIKIKNKADYKQVLKSCPIGNSTVMYNAKQMGKFKVPNISKNNDFALWLKILKKEQYIYGYNEVLGSYRIRSNSISSNKIKMLSYHWKVFRSLEKLSFVYSIYLILIWIFIKIFKLKHQ